MQHMDVIAEAVLRHKAETCFHEFVKQAWHIVEGPNTPFIDNWHIQALCEHLEAVYRGDIRNLIINFPPRSCKSTILSVLWPVWVWIQKPEEQFLFASYRLGLCSRDLRRARWVIESQWFQIRWGHIFQIRSDQNNQFKYTNDMNGYRIATSTDAGTIGEGGNILAMDDPNNAKDGESEAERERAINFYSAGFSNRGNNPKTVRRIITQQRFHERDITGYVLSLEDAADWIKLILPMEFEIHRRAKTISLPSTGKKIWQDPRKKEGELLWPELYGPAEVKKGKAQLGSEYRISGQYAQNPSPSEGGIIKKKYFCWWKKPQLPEIIHIVQSWDTALEANDKTSAYSACTTWGVFNDNNHIAHLILLGMWRGRVEYPELRKMAQRLQKDYRDHHDDPIVADGHHVPDLVLVEAKANGASLIQDLRRAGVMATRFNPTKRGDKIQRVRTISHFLEGGRVYVQAVAPDYTRLKKHADVFLNEVAKFPNGESRDLTDTMTQVLHRLKDDGILTHPADDKEDEGYRKPKEHGYW